MEVHSNKTQPADKGPRGALAQELEKDDCWWHGILLLQNGEDKWPERKIGQAPDAYKEVKSEKKKACEGGPEQEYTRLIRGDTQA